MTSIIANSFTTYQLTEQEALVGSIFTIAQIEVLQNRLSVIAELTLNLVFDPLNPVLFAAEQARLAGQIFLLREIIDASQYAIEQNQQPHQQPQEPPQ